MPMIFFAVHGDGTMAVLEVSNLLVAIAKLAKLHRARLHARVMSNYAKIKSSTINSIHCCFLPPQQ